MSGDAGDSAPTVEQARANRVARGIDDRRNEKVIDLYLTTPNGRKVSIMLEEIGLPYRARTSARTSSSLEFLKVSPNN
jgi:hypothetical protein